MLAASKAGGIDAPDSARVVYDAARQVITQESL
jgi:hypothetical protein